MSSSYGDVTRLGILERIFGWLFRLFDRVLAPVRALRARLDELLLRLADSIGASFAVLGIPFALLAAVGDLIALASGFVASLPRLLLRPLWLIREIVSLPFRALAAVVSRVVQTVLLGFVGRWLDAAEDVDLERLRSALQRRPWLRGLILGFLRRVRPDYPVLIEGRAVRQVLTASRTGLFGKRRFVILVEGDPIEPGLGAAMRARVRGLLLPFYWTRTVHMFHARSDSEAHLLKTVVDATGVEPEAWS